MSRQANPLILFNRESRLPTGSMVWRQIDVRGEHETLVSFTDGTEREMLQVIDGQAIAAIVADFAEIKNRENFAGILVDADHLSHDKKNSTEAMAWLWDVEEHEGQLYGLLDFTDTGAAAINNRRWKLFSTEYDPESLQWLGEGRFRPTRLVGLALTNRPNNKGGKPVLSNRAASAEQNPTPQDNMQSIAEKLKLDPGASEEEILKRLDEITTELEELRGKSAEVAAEEVLNRHAKRVPEGQRDEWKAQLIANRAGTEKLLSLLPERSEGDDVPEVPARVFNRSQAKTPAPVEGKHGDGGDDQVTEKRAALISNRARTMIANKTAANLSEAYRLAEEAIEEEALANS